MAAAVEGQFDDQFDDQDPERFLAAVPGEGESGDQSAPMVAEVDAEPDDGSITVLLGDLPIRVPPAGRWRQSANSAIRVGDFNGWAESVLSEADAEAWVDADPTNDEVNAFFAEWGRLSGVSLGESRASRRSAARTARR